MFDEGNQRGGHKAKMDRLALLSKRPLKRDTGHPHRLIITANWLIQFLPFSVPPLFQASLQLQKHARPTGGCRLIRGLFMTTSIHWEKYSVVKGVIIFCPCTVPIAAWSYLRGSRRRASITFDLVSGIILKGIFSISETCKEQCRTLEIHEGIINLEEVWDFNPARLVMQA